MKATKPGVFLAGIPYAGVIFDMDGTLIESTEADFLAWKWVFADFGHELSFQDYMPMLGIRSTDLLHYKLHLEGDVLQQALAKKMAYFREIAEGNGIHPVPYVEEFLKQVRSYPIKTALATSSRREKMYLLMEKLGWLHYFDAVVTGEEVHHGKPAPDIFLQAAERLGIAPVDCVVLEDAANGVAAAKHAQMTCIAITTTHSAEQLQQADLVVDSYEHADLRDWCQLIKSPAL
jgi:haloacid dehalogenase superfamily, subfamily IA, variant 3 with third motif having DD or ED